MRRILMVCVPMLAWAALLITPAYSQDEPKQADPKAEEKIDLEKVPDGSAEEILKYIEKVRSINLQKAATQEAREKLVEQTRIAILRAAEKILSGKPNEQERTLAIVNKIDALSGLYQLAQDPNKRKAAENALAAFATSLKGDANTQIADQAKILLIQIKLQAVTSQTADPSSKKADAKALLDLAKEYVGSGNLDGTRIQVAQIVPMVLNGQAGERKLAIEACRDFATVLKKSGIRQAGRVAEALEVQAARYDMVGKPIEIVGKTLDGKDFDWSKYKGKVVLVDFWATWCKPCRDELPNVIKAYDTFKGSGFDVVGISIDDSTDRKKLEAFVANANNKQPLPWVTIFSEDEEASGWKNTNAQKFGIGAIPATILVGRDGNVVALDVRGEELQKEIGKLINAPGSKTTPKDKPDDKKPEDKKPAKPEEKDDKKPEDKKPE